MRTVEADTLILLVEQLLGQRLIENLIKLESDGAATMILVLLQTLSLSYLFMIRTQTRTVYILLRQIYCPLLSKGGTFQQRKNNRELKQRRGRRQWKCR